MSVLQIGIVGEVVLKGSLGIVSDEQGSEESERVMCSNCFDRIQDRSTLFYEFVAIAGQAETVYDIDDAHSLGYASKLCGRSIDGEHSTAGFSYPIVCSECQQERGLVRSSQQQ